MNKQKQRLINNIRKIWKQQESLDKKQHKIISSMLKEYDIVDLKEILSEEEIELGMSEHYLDDLDEEHEEH